MNEHILVVEDDPSISTGLVDLLEGEGYEVTLVADGLKAVVAFESKGPDLVLLDVMIPGQSGYDVCRQIRARDTHTPVLMLTAKGQEVDKVVGLELGADDYIVKPFGLQELLARIRAALRRSAANRPAGAAGIGSAGAASMGGGVGAGPSDPRNAALHADELKFGDVAVNAKTLELHRSGETTPITKRELSLLREFLAHDGEVLDRADLLERIWGVRYEGTTRTLDQHIAKLRQKVEADPANPRHIRTVHGVGYRFYSEPPAE
ncbi:MAG: response regulator transcription factor [Candidatus Eisenbacteria bacterium]